MSSDVRDAVRLLKQACDSIEIPSNQPALKLILARATLLNAITHIIQGEKKSKPSKRPKYKYGPV